LKILLTGDRGFPGLTIALYLREHVQGEVAMDYFVHRGRESNIERVRYRRAA
jgi:hypothetical protein